MKALFEHMLQLFPLAAHLISPEVHPDDPEFEEDVVMVGEVVVLVVIPGLTIVTTGIDVVPVDNVVDVPVEFEEFELSLVPLPETLTST